mmetsp:Transcript_29610/g.45171  ORF Transcript_29610/g.45171 Transcript_29610/m.45171 type:complete len:581 (+) Transcript_29610:222-1964(+)
MRKREHSYHAFDYVLVGAGPSAMGFLCGIIELHQGKEQTAAKNFSICVIERGNLPPCNRDPKKWFQDSYSLSSCCSSLVKATLPASRDTVIPTGKGLGGGSNINACVVMLPSANDFESWPSPWRESLLSYTQNLQTKMNENKGLCHFKTSIAHNIPQDEEQRIRNQSQIHFETRFPSFITEVPLSISKKEDGKYRRVNYYESLVKPYLNEASPVKITWLHGIQVERLLFDVKDESRVVGVECQEDSGSWMKIRANLEVILASGAIETPALLIVSGIGPELQSAPCRKNLPVGYNLQDHIMLPRPMFHLPWTSGELSPNSVQAIFNAKDSNDRFQLLLFDAASYPHLLPHFVASQFRRRAPNRWPPFAQSIFQYVVMIFFHLVWLLLHVLLSCTPIYFILRYCVVSSGISLVTTKSRGCVKVLRDKQQYQVPCRRSQCQVVVEKCYLTDDRDYDGLFHAMKIFDKLCQPWYRQALFEILPGKWTRLFFRNERDWFRWYSSNFSLPYFHWGGSCGMERVVDRYLRVKGITGLRVCDASVMPTLPSVPTALTCAGLGYGLARIIFEEKDNQNQTMKIQEKAKP